MERTMTNELHLHYGETIKLQGWIHRIRKLGKIAFIILRDRSGLCQCIIDTKEFDVKGLKLESVVEIEGEVKEVEQKNSERKAELAVTKLNILVKVEEDLPIEINKDELEANIDKVLDYRILSLRNPKTNAIFRVQAVLAAGFSEFLRDEGFTEVFTPKIVAEGTEGGTELFKVKYFEKDAYLAQSPQFYKQMLVGAGYERVYEIGHVYRAEEHNTPRHINEYVSLDLEMGFIKDEEDIMNLETRLLKSMLKKVEGECKEELKLLNAELPSIEGDIPKMRLSEAIQILKDNYGRENLTKDLDPDGEKQISDYVLKHYNSDFVFLTHYPRIKRPMYAMPAEENLTHSFDLIFRGLEITTGGQRIHQYEKLKESIESRGMNAESFTGYLEAFKYGMPPHGGLAIGLERITAQLLGIRNIRETTLFPRDRERLAP